MSVHYQKWGVIDTITMWGPEGQIVFRTKTTDEVKERENN